MNAPPLRPDEVDGFTIREIVCLENKDYAEQLVKRLVEAREQSARKDEQQFMKRNQLLCETCYMRSGNRWGGSAMTPWNCAKCGGHHVAGSTAHESLCLGCAITTGKCQWCNHNKHMLADND